MSYEGTKISPSRLPAATGAALGAIISGSNITNTAGTLSLVAGNITSALAFTPENAANKNAASGYAGLDASSLLTPAQLPFATGAVRGGVITGSNITNTGGTISLVAGNITSALTFTPANKAGDTFTGAVILAADPVTALGAATKQYVDAIATGLDVKASVRVATAAALPAYTRTTNVITASANGVLTVDGVTVALNDRILLKDGAAGSDNGLYSVTTLGTAGVPYVLTRTTDADNSPVNEVTAGLFTYVEEGTVNATTGWVLATANPITLNTTSLTFTQFSQAGVIAAGNGIIKTGNSLAVLADPAGTPTITVGAGGVKVALASLTTSHLSASAGIVDTQLATISTAGKVSDSALSSQVVLKNVASVFTTKITTVLSATGTAGFNLPPGAAPTSPVNGDTWTTTAGLFVQINGATVGPLGSATGTVTSVALSITGPLYSVSGSPVTTSGTLTATIANQTQNTAFMGSNGGGSVAPTFRAIVAADLPTATGAALGVAQGGTGITVTGGVFNVNTATIARALRMVTAAGAVTCTTADDVVIVNKTTGAATAVTLTATPATGDELTIKDGKGDSGTNVITVSPAAGTIDGQASVTIDQNYGARLFVYNGTEWNLI